MNADKMDYFVKGAKRSVYSLNKSRHRLNSYCEYQKTLMAKKPGFINNTSEQSKHLEKGTNRRTMALKTKIIVHNILHS